MRRWCWVARWLTGGNQQPRRFSISSFFGWKKKKESSLGQVTTEGFLKPHPGPSSSWMGCIPNSSQPPPTSPLGLPSHHVHSNTPPTTGIMYEQYLPVSPLLSRLIPSVLSFTSPGWGREVSRPPVEGTKRASGGFFAFYGHKLKLVGR